VLTSLLVTLGCISTVLLGCVIVMGCDGLAYNSDDGMGIYECTTIADFPLTLAESVCLKPRQSKTVSRRTTRISPE
jgi:hypothetical protein